MPVVLIYTHQFPLDSNELPSGHVRGMCSDRDYHGHSTLSRRSIELPNATWETTWAASLSRRSPGEATERRPRTPELRRVHSPFPTLVAAHVQSTINSHSETTRVFVLLCLDYREYYRCPLYRTFLHLRVRTSLEAICQENVV